MSFLRPTGSQWRPPNVGKNYIVSSWRGVLRVQAWPRKRGLPKDQAQRTRLIIFKAVQAIIKWLTPDETIYIKEAIDNFNRTHRGQRGSAAIRVRDWQHQRLMGRGPAVQADNGITFYPAAVARDASFILDHTAPVPGSILQRTEIDWRDIPLGTPGQLLTAGSPGTANRWADP